MHIADPRQVPAGIYACTLHPTRLAMLTEGATPDERALAAKHWQYSVDLAVRGIVVFGGRTIATMADSFAIMVFRAALYPYQPMLMGDWPQEAAEAPAASR